MEKINYYQYIKSEEWQQVRRKFYSSKMYKCLCETGKWSCYCCGVSDKPLDLHHRTYKRLGKENISIDLVPVCRDCHNKIHILEKGGMGLWGATKTVRKKCRRNKKKLLKKIHDGDIL